jgi:hypothetical protein
LSLTIQQQFFGGRFVSERRKRGRSCHAYHCRSVERLEGRVVLSGTQPEFVLEPGDIPAGVTTDVQPIVQVLSPAAQGVANDTPMPITVNYGSGGPVSGVEPSVTATGASHMLLASEVLLVSDTPATSDVPSASVVVADGLEFLASGGFSAAGTVYSASGDVQVGIAPQTGESFIPLLSLNGSVSVDTTALSLSVTGSVTELMSGSALPLFNGSFTASIPALVGQGISGLSGSSLTVAGTTFSVENIALVANGPSGGPAIELQGSIALPGGLTVNVDGANDVVIDGSGVSLTGVDATLQGSLSLGGETFESNALTVGYSPSSETFSITGDASFTISGDTIAVTFGTAANPQGLVVQNGTVSSLSFSVDADISVGGLEFSAQGLTGSYDPTQDTITVVGDASLSFEGNTINVAFGGGSSSGLVIDQGQIASLGMVVNSSFTIDGVSFTTDGVVMNYTAASDSFVMSGPATMSAFGDTLSVNFAGGATGGLVITDGNLVSLDLTASGTFSLFGLTIAASGATVDLDMSDDAYRFSGVVTVSSAAQMDGGSAFQALNQVTATLGSEQALQAGLPPDGLVIQNGQVTELNLTLDGSLNLFGLDLSFTDLALDYNAQSSLLVMSGSASLSFGPFTSVSVTVPSAGLAISTATGAVNVHVLTIAVALGLGLGQSKAWGFQGTFAFSDTTVDGEDVVNYVASGTLDTPQGDFGATVELAHSGGVATLNGVLVSYAAGTGQGIDVDGLFITALSGSVENIGTSSMSISGNIAVDYGGKLGGVSLFSATGSFTWTETSLTGLVTYTLAGGDYSAGGGSAQLDLDFAAQTYEIMLLGTALGGIFSFSAEFELESDSELDLIATTTLNTASLPSWVSSFIGGTSVADLGFQLQYIPGDSADSYAQAWLDIGGEDVGVRVDFDGDVTEVVSGGITQAFQSLAYDATQVYDESASALASAYSTAASALGTGVATTAAAFVSYEQSVATAATNAFNSSVSQATTLYNALVKMGDTQYEKLINEAAADFTSNAEAYGLSLATEMYNETVSDAVSLYNGYVSLAASQYNGMVANAVSTYEAASSQIITATTSIVSAASTALTTMENAVETVAANVESLASTALSGLESTAQTAIKDVESAATAIVNWFESW